tara:strand:+ start:26 stop:235 length:210 start_codon:yes stop_codon:yes gene_type:complete
MEKVFSLSGIEEAQKAQIIAMHSRLGLEIIGITFKGPTAYARIKRMFGIKGNRQSVHDQLGRYIQEEIL